MLCEECHENEADVLITEVDAGGNLTEKHLCKACAAKKGYLLDKQKPLSQMFSELLKELGEGKDEELRCSACGMSWAEFRRLGRFGCERCYQEFGDHVEKLVSRIQGTAQHTGREAAKNQKPSPVFVEMEKKRLRQELLKAIQQEEYEKAARIRDDLKKYEERTEGQ
jgi:protein arginine kinase activator